MIRNTLKHSVGFTSLYHTHASACGYAVGLRSLGDIIIIVIIIIVIIMYLSCSWATCLTRSGLTYPEVTSKVYNDSFRQLGISISLPWVIYFETFCLHVVSGFSCIPLNLPKLVLFLTRETCQWLKLPLGDMHVFVLAFHSIHIHVFLQALLLCLQHWTTYTCLSVHV